jgi:adenylate cyclase
MEILNKVMKIQGKIISANSGDIDKYAGDEIMAVFEGEDAVKHAVESALQIKNEMKALYASGDLDVAVGIGINCGTVIAGNMGSDDRIDRTIIGDAVNLAARLCSLAGKNTVVVSKDVFSAVSEQYSFREHPPVKVKGKSKEIPVYMLRSAK